MASGLRNPCRFGRHVYDRSKHAQCPNCKAVTDREWVRRWRAAHPELAFAAHRESYRRRDKNRLAAQAAKWAQAHPEKKREHRRKNNQRRRAMKRSGPVEAVDAIVVWERDRGRCHICRQMVSLRQMELDHIMPLSRGGWHTYANVKAAHHDCNNWKNARSLKELAS